MKSSHRVLAIALSTGWLTTSGCTWVQPVPGASQVTLVMPQHVSECESLGTATFQVKAQIGPIHRNEAKVGEELLTLAKNSAVEMGGDTLVAEGPPTGGSQRFRTFKCKQAPGADSAAGAW
jgi:hypothetical protein